MGVEDQVETVIVDRFPARVGVGKLFPVDEYSQALNRFLLPQGFACLFSSRMEPGDVILIGAMDGLSLEPAAAAEDRMSPAKKNQAPREFLQFAICMLPVHPGKRVVLAVGIVVSMLGMAGFIAAE